MTKRNEAIVYAFKKGYRIIDGKVHYKGNNPKGFVHAGYLRLNIRTDNNESRLICVHRLLAYQKFGDKIFNKDLQVRHLNGNSLDNSYHNIGIGTARENQMDIDVMTRKIKAGNANRIYDHKDVIDYYNQCRSYRQTMKKFGIKSLGTVNHIIKHSLKSIGVV